jgi:hypothetical protein
MPMKGFYSFTNKGVLLFICAAMSPSEAKAKYDRYEADIRAGRRKREKFSLLERVPDETQQEYEARRKAYSVVSSGANREMRRANIKAIGKIVKKGRVS